MKTGQMPDKSAVLAEAARLRALFQTAGATVVEADVLQPADTLLTCMAKISAPALLPPPTRYGAR